LTAEAHGFLAGMRVILKVSKPSPPPWYHEYEYDQDAISIGRGIKNDLQLEGINSVVSREHAQIIRKTDSFVLVDLNSTNKTVLNGQTLNPYAEYPLRPGDQFRICDYEIEFGVERQAAPEEHLPQPTPPPPRPNPFLQQFEELAKSLDALDLLYEMETVPENNVELHEALQKTLKDRCGKKAAGILGRYLGGDQTMRTVAVLGKDSSDLDVLSNYDRIRNLIDAMLDFLTKLIQARIKFRQEFLNETIVKSKSFSLDSCTTEDLKSFLFDAKASPEEGQKRTEALSLMLEELLLHQLSLLEGYKAGVNEGSKRFLDRLSPARLNEQLAERKIHLGVVDIPVKSIPLVKLRELMRVYHDVFRELTAEDEAVIEERYFRPSYKRSYYSCSRASRRKSPRGGKDDGSPQ